MENQRPSPAVEEEDRTPGYDPALLPVGGKPFGHTEVSVLIDSAATSQNGDRDTRHKSHSSKTRMVRFTWWKKEVFSWFMSVVCLCCIIGTLFAFQDKEIPRWPRGITLNTIVAVLATLEMLFLEAPIANSVAQLKWNWFDESRPLLDFISIERASHGPLGSLKLILRRRGGITAILGALLVIAILSIPPFLQQVVSYNEGTTRTNNAYVSTTRGYATLPNTIPIEQRIALYGAMGGFQTNSPSLNFCPTNNCTWPEYESLSVFGRCNNITDRLDASGHLPDGFGVRLDEMGWGLLYPNGPYNSDTVPFPGHCATPLLRFEARGLEKATFSFSHHDLKFSIFRLVIVSLDDPNQYSTTTLRAKAEECVLSFCTASFNATETNRHFLESRTKSSDPWDLNIEYLSPAKYKDSKSNTTFVLGAGSNRLNEVLASGFAGAMMPCLVIGGPLTNNVIWGVNQLRSPCDQNLFSSADVAGSNNDHLNITTNIGYNFYVPSIGTLGPLIEDAAKRLTKVLRDPSSLPIWISERSKYAPTFYNATGTAFESKTLVHVRWGWIILPITLEILAVVFLLGIMTDTHRRKLVSWRDEGLAALFCGPEETLREEAYKVGNLKNLEKLADTMVVTLQETDKGWRFVRSDGVGQDVEKHRGSPPVES